ncbi:MAG: Heat shock protein GrpE [uncultured Gemmatimonadaceae bacterium]|uniref:Protein GrpE n=1 Tax=uncultured Gemmatimonadaceae bacterium TaxID=246130 RepID=A0A6J4K329_9BACT|nr:MAG: Heat shock protein GrpE [uncultured Gemmatimonadaceae bacterium]
MTNPAFESEGADERGAPGSADSYARGAADSADAGDAPLDVGAADTSGGEAAAGGTELDAQRDRYLRLAAEYDNYRKRSIRERQEAGTRSQADLVRQCIDALDDLARFAHVDPATVDSTTVVQGVEMVEKKLLKSLGAAGLEVLNPVDQTFDPALHEAVATEPAVAREDDHVVARVYQPGYRFGGLLLRPARVVVKQWNG